MILLKKECYALTAKIEELENKIATLPNYDELSVYDIPFYKFRQRKKFLTENDNYNYLCKKLRELKKQLNEINKDLTPEEFKRHVKERKIFLTAEDKEILLNFSDFDSLEELCLVHKCNFMPFNNEIKSALNSSGESLRSFNIGNQTFNYTHKEQRNTVHFSINGEVGSHDMGNWDNRRYGVIVPFKECTNNLLSACSCDTFFKEKVVLNDKCYILCPKEDEEKVRASNNLVNVIPYAGTNVSGYADAVVSFLGYKHQKVGNHGWLSKDQYAYDNLMRKNNFEVSEHFNTKYYNHDLIMNNYYHIIEIYTRLLCPDINIDNTIFQNMKNNGYADNVYYNLYYHLSSIIEKCAYYFKDYFTKRDKTINFLLNLFNILKEINPELKLSYNFAMLQNVYDANGHSLKEEFIHNTLNDIFISLIKKNRVENLETINKLT